MAGAYINGSNVPSRVHRIPRGQGTGRVTPISATTGRPSRGWQPSSEDAIKGVLFVTGIFAILALFFIITYLFIQGWDAFVILEPAKFLLGTRWFPITEPPEFGSLPLVTGTVLVSLLSLVVSIPLGVGAAIFIAVYAPKKVKDAFKVVIEVLAGVPSVVYGFFGMKVVTGWVKSMSGLPSGYSLLAGAIVIGIMSIPTITSVSEDAISAVPREMWEGSLGLGATKWQSTRNVILPAAFSGIGASIILGIGRALGETMAVIMVCGNAPRLPTAITDVFLPVYTITAALGVEMGEVPRGSEHYKALFGLAIILFLFVLAVNTVANTLVKRIGERNAGKSKPVMKPRRAPSRMLHAAKRGGWPAWIAAGSLCFCVTWMLAGIMPAVAVTGGIITVVACGKLLPARIKDRIACIIVFCCAAMVIYLLALIITHIFQNGLHVVTWDFLTQGPKNLNREGGIAPAIWGSLSLVLGAVAIAMPIGIGAAIFLNEYAREGKLKSFIRAGIDNLNGTPSIIFGLFGMVFFCWGWGLRQSLLAGQLTVSLMILPTIIRTTEESLKTIPAGIREGSLALGATKWGTISKVVLPAAMPGSITGVILGVGRIIGETAPLIFTAATFTAKLGLPNAFNPAMFLSTNIYFLASEIHDGSTNAYGTAVVLLVIVFICYGISIAMRVHFKKKIRWS